MPQTALGYSDSFLLLENDMQQAASAQFLYGRVSFFSSKSPQKETANEDALLVVNFNDTCTVLALADGVGGHKRGAEAAKIALGTLQEELLLSKESVLRSVIVSAIEKANENILALGVGAATTLVIALLEDGHFQTFHAGDSACYVLGGRGKIKWKTTAHSAVGYAEEAGMLSEQEALAHEDRNVVLNVLGDKEMHIGVGPKKSLSRKDRVILASDGILDNLSESEMINRACLPSLEAAASDIFSLSQQRMKDEKAKHGGPDDASLLIWEQN